MGQAACSGKKGAVVIDRSKLDNPFVFVVVAGARARQLMKGAVARVPVGSGKPIVVAQHEVLAGLVSRIAASAPEAEAVETTPSE